MNEFDKQLAIELAEREIKRLQAHIASLRNGDDKPSRRGRRKNGAERPITQLAQQIETYLKTVEGSISPKDLHSALRARGYNCTAADIRTTLRNFKDRLFKSPEFGRWEWIGTKKEDELELSQ